MSLDITQTENTPEEEQTLGAGSMRDSRRVVIISASMVIATGLVVLIFDLVHAALGRTLVGITIGIVAVGIALAFFDRLQPARIITTTSSYLVLTYFLIEGDGIHDATITAYAAVVILGGLLLGEMGVIIFGSLTTISLAVLAYAEIFGLITNRFSDLFDTLDMTVIWFLHLATSAIVYFLVRRLSRLAREAQKGELESIRSNKELSELRDVLQERVEQRTAVLEAQNSTLQASSRVANAILTAPDVSTLIRTSTDLITQELGYEHAGIFLLNEKKDRVILQAASSEGGRTLLQERYELPLNESSTVGFAARNKRPRIIFNQGLDKKFFDNPHLSTMQSQIALPLISQNEVLGVLDIQTPMENAFSEGNIAIFQALANQIALTLQNTRLIEESRINLSELELVVAEQSTAVWNRHLQQNTHGFVYTPLGVKPLRTARLQDEKNPAAEKAEIPITLRGRKIGTISMQRLARNWTRKEKELLNDVAMQIGLAVENARLLYETREQAHQDQLVSDVSTRLRETLDMDTVLKTAIEEMKRTFNLKEVQVHLAPTDSPEAES